MPLNTGELRKDVFYEIPGHGSDLAKGGSAEPVHGRVGEIDSPKAPEQYQGNRLNRDEREEAKDAEIDPNLSVEGKSEEPDPRDYHWCGAES